ncbi:uncharacterized protein LOC122073250 isoform X2 [Macadamia integrifolia]|uniref:uncharacterized protein LOC122073250 isoform X2 n=1 Tax=Macadamia integrifolia TaxID=60698 RepID=UPI001C4EC2C2|nr:uncharacterized protein LOC122073250 isoform X2 [Macadamia integrifolia]
MRMDLEAVRSILSKSVFRDVMAADACDYQKGRKNCMLTGLQPLRMNPSLLPTLKSELCCSITFSISTTIFSTKKDKMKNTKTQMKPTEYSKRNAFFGFNGSITFKTLTCCIFFLKM